MTDARDAAVPTSPGTGEARNQLPRRVFVKPSSASNVSITLSIALIVGLLALAYLLSGTPSG